MIVSVMCDTVKPRPEEHRDMILFEVFLKSIDLIPQSTDITTALFTVIDNVIVPYMYM